ncbi:MAG TPA: FAD-binding protein [Candidatus Limnocylindrales bacterium]|nr:FAD-binding protein [Candidatus Limnocylindrales bacterium]
MTDAGGNWSATYAYRASRLHEPGSVEELQELVRRAPGRIRALGSRHSFNGVADTDGDLVSMRALPRRLEIDADARVVTVDGGARYGDLCEELDAAGFALHNLASLPHISVAGACATGTHGSGERNGNLATAVAALDLVDADGEIRRIGRGENDDLLPAAAVSLGSLGIVTAIQLRIEPTFDVRQDVFEDLPLDAFRRHFDEIEALGDSVSFFTEWRGEAINQVWLKRRVTAERPGETIGDLFGARPADGERHPIRALSPEACTPQLGVPGPWHARLPHFRMEFTPSSGDEIQSEFFVGREDAVPAFEALDRLRDTIAPLIHVSEIRAIAADELWLSPAHGRPSIAFHFTWQRQPEAVAALLPEIERALEPFMPRPHWGKVFTMEPSRFAAAYPRLADFRRAAEALDPEARFRNAFVHRYVFETAG